MVEEIIAGRFLPCKLFLEFRYICAFIKYPSIARVVAVSLRTVAEAAVIGCRGFLAAAATPIEECLQQTCFSIARSSPATKAIVRVAQPPSAGCSVSVAAMAALVARRRHLEPAKLASEVVVLVVVSVHAAILHVVVSARSALADVVIVDGATVRVRSSAVASAAGKRILALVSRYSVPNAVVGVLTDAVSVAPVVAMCQI